MVRRTGGSAPDVMEAISADAMEPISYDAMNTIAAARARIISLREICSEHTSSEVKDALLEGLDELRDALEALGGNIEALMEIGEPAPFMAPMPTILEAIQAIEALGHEARLMVVDWTLYRGLYPLIAEASAQGE